MEIRDADSYSAGFVWCPWGSEADGQPVGWQLARIVGSKIETKLGREIIYLRVRKYMNKSRRWTKTKIWVNRNGVLRCTAGDVRSIKRAIAGKSIDPKLRF